MQVTFSRTWLLTPEFIVDEAYKMIEQAARTCYKSEGAICEGSAEKMVRKLLSLNHGAMLEHADLSMRIVCDRGVSHEIVRHRIASYAQESTRYCNYGSDKFGNEVTYVNILPGLEIEGRITDSAALEAILQEWRVACEDAERHYLRMLQLGCSPQMARSVLNNSTKTEIVVKMNLREWRHFLSLRNSPAAHPQMREIAGQVMSIFKDRLPVIVADL